MSAENGNRIRRGLEWLPYYVNYRRNGYDFDARYQDGLASRREKKIMDFLIGEDKDSDTLYKDEKNIIRLIVKAPEEEVWSAGQGPVFISPTAQAEFIKIV